MHSLHGPSGPVVHSAPAKLGFIVVLAIAVAVGGFGNGSHVGMREASTVVSHSGTHPTEASNLSTTPPPTSAVDRAPRITSSSVQAGGLNSTTWAAFPPREMGASYAAGYAPMGIADLGQSSSGSSFYTTSSFAGSAKIESLGVCATASPCGSTSLSFQLNLNLGFEAGGNWYDYWIQDVAVVDTTSQSLLSVENNIWNLSAPGASMYNSTVSGYGSVSSYEGVGYYGDGFYVPASYGEFQLIANTSLNSYRQPVVSFMFDVGSGF